jgi:hypothetical protein
MMVVFTSCPVYYDLSLTYVLLHLSSVVIFQLIKIPSVWLPDNEILFELQKQYGSTISPCLNQFLYIISLST